MATRAITDPALLQGWPALEAALRSPSDIQLLWQRHWPLQSEPIDLMDACARARDGHAERLFAEVPC